MPPSGSRKLVHTEPAMQSAAVLHIPPYSTVPLSAVVHWKLGVPVQENQQRVPAGHVSGRGWQRKVAGWGVPETPASWIEAMGLPPHPPTETAAHNKRGKHRRMKALGADQGIVPAFGITILLRKVRAHLQWRAKTTWPHQLVEQGTEELARISGGVASGRGRMRAMAASRSLA
jgi:hypothetical protein